MRFTVLQGNATHRRLPPQAEAMGRKRYPLVLMLEPLFRCNLACVGCGKIDYPDPILNRRLSVKECLEQSTSAARRWWRSPAASR